MPRPVARVTRFAGTSASGGERSTDNTPPSQRRSASALLKRDLIHRLELANASAGEAAFAAGQPAPSTGARQYEIPLILPASHPTAEGLVRIVNLSGESGEVQVVAEQPHPYR